jgi:hypothetical protein
MAKKTVKKKSDLNEAPAAEQEIMQEEEKPPEVVEGTAQEVVETEVEVHRNRCISCGSYVVIGDGSVLFPCPECGELIGRCANCRALGRRYTCKCEFTGP